MAKGNQRFGSAHTEEKLSKLEAYLKAYTTALKNQHFRLLYFDAFAGTGDIQTGAEGALLKAVDDYSPFIKGSADRALQFGSAFEEYIFVEKDRAKALALQSLKQKYRGIAERISIKHSDANQALLAFCAQTNWKKARAVVFLDPFGNQVHWTTIEAVAKTKAIDLWYLFPAGLGVFRQIGKDGKVHETHHHSLNTLFGTTDWRPAFIKEHPEKDLFGTRDATEKIATSESITLFMIERMKSAFDGRVLDEWLPLGSRGIHMYSLLFAWANPDLKAALAGKLARAVLRSKPRGRA